MIAATRSLRTHAEAALAVFQTGGAPPERQATIQRLRQLLAEANAKAEYAEQLCSRDVRQELHEQIERHAKDALERYYHLGQLLAMPQLIDLEQQRGTRPASSPARPRRRPPLPGEPRFDPWCLTDPASRERWQRDPRAREAIAALWEHDPDPQRTRAIQAEIEAALAQGDIAYATNQSGDRLGHFYCCPWAPVYVAQRPVTVGGQRLRPLQQFVFDVSAEEVPAGGEFKRRILVGVFQPTTEVDYCTPGAGGHHGDAHD